MLILSPFFLKKPTVPDFRLWNFVNISFLALDIAQIRVTR